MNNSIAWHDTFFKKYRVTKVVLQHVSDYNDKKVFVEVSIIIMVVVLSFVWFMDWTDRFIRKGGIGIFDIFFLRSVFVPKNFGFSDWVFIMDFPSFSIWFSVFVINTCLMGFGFGFQYGFRIFLSGFRFLFDLIGHYAPPLISSCRETSVCSTCQHCIRSIRVLKTEMWTLKDFDGFAWGFRFWSNLFAVLRLWIIFLTA